MGTAIPCRPSNYIHGRLGKSGGGEPVHDALLDLTGFLNFRPMRKVAELADKEFPLRLNCISDGELACGDIVPTTARFAAGIIYWLLF